MAQTINADDGVISGSAGLKSSSDGTAILSLQTKGTTALTVDGSQNVGIGVTPSAWDSGKVIEVNQLGTAFWGNGVNNLWITSNAYYNGGNFKYGTGGGNLAGAYQMVVGQHRWYLAPAGTNAGDTITFTQAMTLDASGRLLVGTTTAKADNNLKIQLNAGSNQAAIFAVNRLDDYGLLVGYNNTTGADYGVITVVPNTPLVFSTNNTERARITSGGFFKATSSGTYVSSIGGYHELVSDASDVIVWATNSSASPFGYYVSFSNDPNNASNYVFGANTGGTLIYRIYSNGTTAARSDARFKKNIETTRDGYLADVNALRVVKYNWHNHEEGTPKELGLIAQEVEQVFPGLVKTENEGEEDECKAIKTSVLVPILIKALQEATSRIEALEAKVAALESK